MSLTENPHPQPKNFFQVQTARLAASFELLTGSVALTGREKFPRKATCDLVFFSQNSLKAAGRQSVKPKFGVTYDCCCAACFGYCSKALHHRLH